MRTKTKIGGIKVDLYSDECPDLNQYEVQNESQLLIIDGNIEPVHGNLPLAITDDNRELVAVTDKTINYFESLFLDKLTKYNTDFTKFYTVKCFEYGAKVDKDWLEDHKPKSKIADLKEVTNIRFLFLFYS